MADWDVSTASEEFLADLCQRTLEEQGSIGDVGGIPVVKISLNIVAKIGRGVAPSEAATQSFAHKELDPSIAYVPKVYRYFRRSHGTPHDERGYLYMEYIPGQNLQDLEAAALAELVPRVLNIIKHLGQFCGDSAPGPLGGGVPMGHIYGDDGAKTVFDSMEQMNVYMNKRLEYRNIYLARSRGIECSDTIDLTPHPLVLCHGDICRRNIILREDGSLCLLDWGYAGFYPWFFEVVALRSTMPYLDVFEGALEREIEGTMELTDQERRDLQLVMFIRGANLRWSFDEPSQAEHVESIESSQQPPENGGSGQPPIEQASTEATAQKNTHTQHDEDTKPDAVEITKAAA